MSRSYRKVPKITGASSRKNGKAAKRKASKAIRNYKGDISDGKSYKKIYCSWNIRDHRPRCFDKTDKWFILLKRK